MAKSKFDEMHDEIEATRASIVALFSGLVSTGVLEKEAATDLLEMVIAPFSGKQRVAARERLQLALAAFEIAYAGHRGSYPTDDR